MAARQTRIPDEEQTLVNGILEYCKLKPVRAHHGRPARTAVGYRTAIQGDPGFFDLVIVGEGGIIFAECKRRKGAKWQPGQREWSALVGLNAPAEVHVRTWTFNDWPPLGGGPIRELIDRIAKHQPPPQRVKLSRAEEDALPFEAPGYTAPPPGLGPVEGLTQGGPPTPPASGASVSIHLSDAPLPGMGMAQQVAREIEELRLRRARLGLPNT